MYQRTYAIVPKVKDDSIIYLIYSAMATEFISKIKESLHGSAIPYIVYNDIAKFEISHNDQISTTCNVIRSVMNTIILNNCEIQKLLNLQRSLLSNLAN